MNKKCAKQKLKHTICGIATWEIATEILLEKKPGKKHHCTRSTTAKHTRLELFKRWKRHGRCNQSIHVT